MSREKKRALADYLEIGPFEIKEEPGHYYGVPADYITPEGTYWVLDENESRQAVYDDIESFIDEVGLYGAFTPNFVSWIEDNALDQEWFKDWFYEDYISYAEDIEHESDSEYGNRLNAECIENGVISEDDIVDGEYTGDEDLYSLLATALVDDIENSSTSFSEEFKFQLGDDSLKQVLKENPDLIDLDAIVDEAIQWDDYGHFISSWDGKTIELDNGLYAYKQDE